MFLCSNCPLAQGGKAIRNNTPWIMSDHSHRRTVDIDVELAAELAEEKRLLRLGAHNSTFAQRRRQAESRMAHNLGHKHEDNIRTRLSCCRSTQQPPPPCGFTSLPSQAADEAPSPCVAWPQAKRARAGPAGHSHDIPEPTDSNTTDTTDSLPDDTDLTGLVHSHAIPEPEPETHRFHPLLHSP